MQIDIFIYSLGNIILSAVELNNHVSCVASMLRDHAQCLLDSITDDCGSDDANVVADIMDRSFDPAASLIECDLNLIVKEGNMRQMSCM